MRNGQNKRMRGRNRKSQNPMTRVFESNGPDVKIRGTPSHIAEKYLQLARDAQTSGDPVAAENYYQHAEHYFRLIAAAQEQFRQTILRPTGARTNARHARRRLRWRRDGRPAGHAWPRRGAVRPASCNPICCANRSPNRRARNASSKPIRSASSPTTRRVRSNRRLRPLTATSTGCRPSSPADNSRTRSRAKIRRATDQTVTRTRAIASRCTAAAEGTAARATKFRAPAKAGAATATTIRAATSRPPNRQSTARRRGQRRRERRDQPP